MRKYYFVAVLALSVCMGLFAMYHLYQNSKTDGFDRGSIEVSECHEKNWSWRIYTCTGDYTSGVGMMGKHDVSATVSGDEPHKGDVIEDVYPATFQNKMSTNHFVTGKERSSVLYNTYWLVLLFASILTPLAMALYSAGTRHAKLL